MTLIVDAKVTGDFTWFVDPLWSKLLTVNCNNKNIIRNIDLSILLFSFDTTGNIDFYYV